MEFIFDILNEIIFEPIIEVYIVAMSHFSIGSRKINKDKLKAIVVIEAIALLIAFVVGGCMVLETDGESLFGKILLISSVLVSIIQISFGIIFRSLKKKDDFTRKIVNEEQLKDLIKRMCNEDDCSEESISWQAYREAEKLSNKSFLPLLYNTVIENKKNTKRDKTVRKSVYFIIGRILKNSFDENGCRFLIDRLDVETDKYILEHILGELIWVDIPLNIDIEPIIRLSKSDKWLTRHSAIQALGSSATVKSKEALYFYLNQSDEKKYEHDIVYANFALGKIGKSEDIPVLEQRLTSRNADIRDSALYAIDSIKERSCML
jgi:HEAT repeat protein